MPQVEQAAPHQTSGALTGAGGIIVALRQHDAQTGGAQVVVRRGAHRSAAQDQHIRVVITTLEPLLTRLP